ncbi:MAG TPA: hypothetical protein VK506_14460 [Conexibacter sp.]|nr:hypothetical protein [Conexibacter sp.]
MSDAPVADAGQAGWTLVQLSELIRRVEELLLDGITLAGPHLHAGMPPDAALELTATDVRRVIAALAEGVEIAEHLDLLAGHVPDGAIDVGYEAVRDAAAADLAGGIADPRRALLAARLLDVEHGWPALATALDVGDAVETWQALTVEELLGRFRGAERGVVRDVLADAGLPAGARFAACPLERLAALADGLRRRAGNRPAR